MAQLRLTGKGAFILVLVLSFVAFGLGFGIFQLAGNKTFNPTGSNAAGSGNPTGCYDPTKCAGVAQNCVNGQVVCQTYQRIHCCDGTWAKDVAPYDEKECSSRGGVEGNCKAKVNQACFCQNFAGCGTNCTFPANTQTQVDRAAVGSCGKKMAFCVMDSKGNTTIDVRDAGSCWDKRDVCNNPTAQETCAPVEVNVCDGGAMTAPSNSAQYNIGDKVKLEGYAFDKDGVDKTAIEVKVDGSVVGNATATDHTCGTDAACTAAAGKPVVDWTYTYTVTSAGAHTFDVTWKDTKGVTGANCSGSRSITGKVTEVNVCEGGRVTSPDNASNYDVGDEVTISGYAFDKDGINKNKIVVKVNGVVAGNATATDHDCTSSNDAVCTAAGSSDAVDWTYTYTVTNAGAYAFSVSWEDTKGVTGSNCQGSRSITSNVQGNPAWEITKSGTSVCIDERANQQKARIDYVITVKNVGTLAGQLTDLVDTQDTKMHESYVTDSSVTPSATVSGRVLTWALDGSAGQFDVNESKQFKYSVVIPQSAFGTYTNTAVATPDSGEAFQAIEIVTASCSPAVVPDTALFDSAISKVALGVILIAISGAYLYSDNSSFNFLGKKKDRRKDFEDRVAGE